MRKGKLGQMLVEAKLITKDQLQKAVDMQKILGGKLGTIIVKLGFISDEGLMKFLAKQENLAITDLSELVIPKALVEKLPRDLLEKHQVVPVRAKGDVVTLAMSDPTDFEAIEDVQFLGNCQVEITMASRAQIAKALNELFYVEEKTPAIPKEDEGDGVLGDEGVPEVEPGLERALIPLLVDKGIITLEELREKARALGKGMR